MFSYFRLFPSSGAECIKRSEVKVRWQPLMRTIGSVLVVTPGTCIMLLLIVLLLVSSCCPSLIYGLNDAREPLYSSLQSSDAPVLERFSFSSNTRLGSKASVVCAVTSGSEPLTFQWLKDQRPIQSSSDVEIGRTKFSSTLSLSPVSSSHAGNWTCQVKNEAGVASHTSSLDVERECHSTKIILN